MTWAELIDSYLEHQRARGLHPRTLRQDRRFLAELARFCGRMAPGQVGPEHLALHRRAFSSGLLPSTVNERMLRLRQFFRWAQRRGHLLLDPSRELVLERELRPPVRVATPEQLERLLLLPDPGTALGLRDRALLETFYGTGIRLEECHRLELTDLDLKGRSLAIRQGKGGRPRRLPLGCFLYGVLVQYLEEGRPRFAPAPGESALFLDRQGRRLSYAAIACLVRDYGRQAGLAPLSPHRLRHAFATHLLEGGAQLRYIQVLLGHAFLVTTELYTRIRPVELFELVRRCHPRARRRSPGPPRLACDAPTLRRPGS